MGLFKPPELTKEQLEGIISQEIGRGFTLRVEPSLLRGMFSGGSDPNLQRADETAPAVTHDFTKRVAEPGPKTPDNFGSGLLPAIGRLLRLSER